MPPCIVPPEIDVEAGRLLDRLGAAQWRGAAAKYDAANFGNWHVDLERDGEKIRLVKDRSQVRVDASKNQLEQANLWKAFEVFDEFCNSVIEWAGQRKT
jgi:hypothetical protein